MTDAADKAAEDEARAMELFVTRRNERLALDRARAANTTEVRHCLDCGEAISGDRLNAVPGATRCTHDAAKVERA